MNEGGERRRVATGTAVRAFAPASVGNLACGFDVLGMALAGAGDTVAARTAEEPGVRLTVSGDGGRLPRRAEANTAGVAARALLEAAGRDDGLELALDKGLPLASGLGSSAASAVAAAVAVDRLLGLGAGTGELLAAAMQGERVASGSPHPDNAAASLLGGIVLSRARADAPGGLEAIRLPVPAGLAVAVVRPHLEVATAGARRVLPARVALADAVAHSADLAGLVAGLYRGDPELVGRCLVDRLAEPARAGLVRGFAAAKRAALDAGALGASLSGAGPSTFALCASREVAERVGEAMRAAFAGAGVEADLILSSCDAPGARVLAD